MNKWRFSTENDAVLEPESEEEEEEDSGSHEVTNRQIICETEDEDDEDDTPIKSKTTKGKKFQILDDSTDLSVKDSENSSIIEINDSSDEEHLPREYFS